MRRVFLALVCLVIVVPLAGAQATMRLVATVEPPAAPIADGQVGTLHLIVTRQCNNAIQVGSETELAVAFQGPDGTLYDGPERLALEQQPCSVEPQQTVEASYQVTLSAAMQPASSVSVQFTISDLGSGTPVAPTSEQYTGEFVLSKAGNATAPDSEDAQEASEPKENEAPAPSGFLALAVVALVALLRRRV